MGLKRSLFVLCCFFNVPFAVYALLALFMPTSLIIVGIAVVFEYFGYGFGFVGLILYMMQQIAPGKYKMAHYAFATGIMSLGHDDPFDAERLHQRLARLQRFLSLGDDRHDPVVPGRLAGPDPGSGV